MARIYYIMGVTSSGKSTIGKMLAEHLQIPFFDGDDFHPQANIEKMSAGIPLNDIDRLPWLENLAQLAESQLEAKGAIIACSALKEQYRNLLQKGITAQTIWLFLYGDQALIQERIAQREGHFMPPELVKSQFDALELPQDENVITLDIAKQPNELLADILVGLKGF